MKVLIYMIRWKGGVGRVIDGVREELESLGHEVKVISREDDLKLYSTIKSFFKIIKTIRKENYDILYTKDWSCALPLLTFKNHYCCFHGIEQSGMSKMLQRYVGLKIGNKLFVVGDKLNKVFNKSTIAYNGYNPEEFYDLKVKRNKCGWIDKGAEMVDKDYIKLYAKNHNLLPTIAKNISPKKMNEWYNSLNTFISYPSKDAGFNLCWLEAKASGVPNVLGNENGIGIDNLKYYKTFTWKNNVSNLLTKWKGEEK